MRSVAIMWDCIKAFTEEYDTKHKNWHHYMSLYGEGQSVVGIYLFWMPILSRIKKEVDNEE